MSSSSSDRWSRKPLPPYTYVPGASPHPRSDRAGHAFGTVEPTLSPESLLAWSTCEPYLYGVDLFNRGYYWEAHEAWEAAWHVAPRADRSGGLTCFLKGLIKLAAAGVKLYEGNLTGVRRHATRAAELLEQSLDTNTELLGMRITCPLQIAKELGEVRDDDARINCDLAPPRVLLPALELQGTARRRE